jgi:predicted RNA binding protein YcfA (HicA-like mRNA interferase family)
VAKLPIDLSGREVRAALERAGFVFRRQSGSHMILRRDEPHARVVVPRRTPSKQKFVGERRRSQLAELEIGAAAARIAILLSI